MDIENGTASFDVRPVHGHTAVEATGAQQRRIENVGPVGGGDQNDIGVGAEAVHLNQDLVERLLTFIVGTAQTGAAIATDGVDLVDEDDARAVALGLLKEVAHTAGAHAHKHLDKFGAGDAEEGHARLARDGLGHQRLAGAGRADQQHALGNASAQRGELLRLLKKLDDLLQLHLGLIRAGHVIEDDRGRSPVKTRALLLPNDMAWLLLPWVWRKRMKKRPTIKTSGSRLTSSASQLALLPGGS